MVQAIDFTWEQVGLEQAFVKYLECNKPALNREFIPIQWSDFYFNNLFKENPDLSPIQDVLDKLDTSKKYFTVVEIEEGVVNDYSHLDLVTFSPGGNGHIPIPYPTKKMNKLEAERTTLCTFMGSIESHPVREEMFDMFKNTDGFEMWKSTTTTMYEYTLSTAIFSLCPRGRGPGSYRFFESLYMGCIPVYVSDVFLTPFQNNIDWDRLCIMVSLEDIHNIPNILKSKTDEEIKAYQSYGREVYDTYFQFDKMCENIISIVNS